MKCLVVGCFGWFSFPHLWIFNEFCKYYLLMNVVILGLGTVEIKDGSSEVNQTNVKSM
jgi:hypothetical protein